MFYELAFSCACYKRERERGRARKNIFTASFNSPLSCCSHRDSLGGEGSEEMSLSALVIQDTTTTRLKSVSNRMLFLSPDTLCVHQCLRALDCYSCGRRGKARDTSGSSSLPNSPSSLVWYDLPMECRINRYSNYYSLMQLHPTTPHCTEPEGVFFVKGMLLGNP